MTAIASFCTSCGARLAAGARLCPSCGTAAAATAGVPAPAAAPPAAPPVAPPPPWSAQAQPAVPAARRESHWKRNFAIVVVLFMVGVLGLAFFATSGPAEAVDRHLSLLAQGDLQTAYAETSDGFKGQATFAKFTQLVESSPILRKNTAVWTSRSINGDEAVIEGTLTAPDQAKAKAEYHLAKGADGTWRIIGFGVTPLSTTGDASPAAAATSVAGGAKVQMSVTATPAKVTTHLPTQLSVKVKNSGASTISYQDIKNNVYAFELWQKDKAGAQWMLEAQGYSYFRDLPDERQLVVQDFGTIRPGEEKELTITFQSLGVSDTVPTAPTVSVIGKDQSGTVYTKHPGPRTPLCGSGIYRLEYIKVTNLHPNARGVMIADVDPNPVAIADMDLGAKAGCP